MTISAERYAGLVSSEQELQSIQSMNGSFLRELDAVSRYRNLASVIREDFFVADIPPDEIIEEAKAYKSDAEKWRQVANEQVITDPCQLANPLDRAQVYEDAEKWREHESRLTKQGYIAITFECVEKLKSDAELGALVRKMPSGCKLTALTPIGDVGDSARLFAIDYGPNTTHGDNPVALLMQAIKSSERFS